jgi:hypothetical protein
LNCFYRITYSPPLGALNWYQICSLHQGTNRLKRWFLRKGDHINDKEKEKETIYVDEPKGDKPTDSGSNNKRKDGKKKRRIKKIINYDSDASSSSPRDDDDKGSSSKKKTVNQNYSFDYSRFPYNLNAHLLSIPLGKPPHIDGEDYSF